MNWQNVKIIPETDTNRYVKNDNIIHYTDKNVSVWLQERRISFNIWTIIKGIM